ncbi:GYF domain containing protein [Nitzschia inconspicua]|uniref:GYF domain containing protein n=1 Tax=Nitzschia inconspicua TaxID=303405 RepID=A0A9K3PIX4_9STRA|nr:GYF domain containing protein [Nitzschia inconspicua]
MSSPSNNSSLRPGWFKGSSGKGFQPPPTATDRGDKGRSTSIGNAAEERRDSNKFAALLDDDDVVVGNGGDASPTSSSKPSTNSRSEAFRSAGFHRSSSTGNKPPGRSLADLAAKVPEASVSGRRHTSFGEGGRSGSTGNGRFSALRGGNDAGASGGSIDAYKPDPKVTRYTREKLLSLRPAPKNPDPGPPEVLKPLEGSVVYSLIAQDPVCWDTFDAETIWENAYREKRASGVGPGKVGVEADLRRRNAPNSGRWTRGLALPPPEEAARRREREADNPNELWDDPTGGATGAAADFSAFGAMPADGDDDGAFDFDKMAEASRQLEEELHGNSLKEEEEDELEKQTAKKVDISRPLASAGTTLVSGSGDDVNVFEDFDAPSEPGSEIEEAETKPAEAETPAVRGVGEDPSASSRLMKMIGVTKGTDDVAKGLINNPWGVDPIQPALEPGVDPIVGAIGGGSLSLNPWGDPVGSSVGSQSGGLGLGLGAFGADTKNHEAMLAIERQKAAEREAEILRRRQQEEEAQRRALAEQKARQQQASMQQPTQQSQIELVLIERICVILENSWGRSDLGSILATLHSEDSRVIPLLQNADSLRALIARSPQRIALRRDPNFGGGEMAVLLLTNSQWQQQQQAQMQQEEIRRRRQMEEEASRAQAQRRLAASINYDAPWFYSDPQNNIQGPFRGEEMRQWLEAGYFKGDLPISQVPNGPFRPLSAWFPDLNFAFSPQPSNGNGRSQALAEEKAKAQAAEEERLRKEAEVAERERRAAEEAQRIAREAAQREAASREAEQQRRALAAEAKSGELGNESSNQLKMMLGLPSGGVSPEGAEKGVQIIPSKSASNDKKGKSGNKKTQQKNTEDTAALLSSSQPPAPSPATAAPAWGGAAAAKQSKKSMSEIQQEEARAAAIMAAKRGNMPQASSGWANVAAGTTGWSSGAIRQAPTANAASIAPQSRAMNQSPAAQGGTSRKVAPLNQQTRSSSTASATPSEEFGAKIPPALESWSREKIYHINGSDDITLIAFCMTLDDANDIRQYFTTYLGSSPQVSSFANEFINKRGLGSKQEEWETPGSAKKSRKKKSGR